MGMFDQVRDAMKMRGEAKRIEAEIKKIAVTPEAYDEVKAGKPARFETMLLNTVNGALKRARDTVQQEMMKQMQAGGGLGGLFGK